MPSREELLQSIKPGMILDKAFFLRIYGYDISSPGFAEKVLEKLDGFYMLYGALDDVRPTVKYQDIVTQVKERREQEMKEVSALYVKQLNDKWERKVKAASAGNRKIRYQFRGFPENW